MRTFVLPPLSLDDWRSRDDLDEPDFLLGNWLSTTSRALLTAATGIGKTNFAIALGMRVAAGLPFLH
jgi:RecA-family ATPase